MDDRKNGRKIENNINFLKNLFKDVDSECVVELDEEDNFVYYYGDLAVTLCRGINSLFIVYDELNDEYVLYHENTIGNKSGAHHVHEQKRSRQLEVVVKRALNLHNNYKEYNKKKSRKKSVWDTLDESKKKS